MFFEMRFDLGTLDSGERSLPFGLLVVIVLINRDLMHAGDEISRNCSIHRMHHNYFYATNYGANCLGQVVFGRSLACYLQSYHVKNILDWFTVPFFSKVRFLGQTYRQILSY